MKDLKNDDAQQFRMGQEGPSTGPSEDEGRQEEGAQEQPASFSGTCQAGDGGPNDDRGWEEVAGPGSLVGREPSSGAAVPEEGAPGVLSAEQVVAAFLKASGGLANYCSGFLRNKVAINATVKHIGWLLLNGCNEGRLSFESPEKVRNWAWATARNLKFHHFRDLDLAPIPQAHRTHTGKRIDHENFSYNVHRPGDFEPFLVDTPEDTALKREALRLAPARSEAKERLVKLLNPDDVRKFFEPIAAKPGTKEYHAQIVARGRALRRMKLHLAMMGIHKRRDLEAYLDELLGLF
jgi:hypothetical protein